MTKSTLLALFFFLISIPLILATMSRSASLHADNNQVFSVYYPLLANHRFVPAVVPFAEGIKKPSVPTAIVDPGDGRLFVALKDGRVLIVTSEGHIETGNLLDIRDRVNSAQMELGLLGLATHPNFAENGYLYAYFSRNVESKLVSDLARFTVDHTGVADPDSEQTIMRLKQPGTAHMAGALQFGPLDRYLYIATGDGGTPRDIAGHAQSGQSLLGKILRIDIDHGSPYAIPQDNPFVGYSDVRDEIWAFGLRNPWRFSFDTNTGDMYIGDVGEQTWEEINFLPFHSQGGHNFGWPCYEGREEYNIENCDSSILFTEPIHAYTHLQDTQYCSVIGGFVYRGDLLPELAGSYVFADYCASTLWTLSKDDAEDWTAKKLGDYSYHWTTFGERSDGELFLGAANNNTIYQLVRNDTAPR